MKTWRITLNQWAWPEQPSMPQWLEGAQFVPAERVHFDYDDALYQVTTEQGWAKVWSRGGEFSTGKALDLGVTLKEAWPESVLYKMELLETDDE